MGTSSELLLKLVGPAVLASVYFLPSAFMAAMAWGGFAPAAGDPIVWTPSPTAVAAEGTWLVDNRSRGYGNDGWWVDHWRSDGWWNSHEWRQWGAGVNNNFQGGGLTPVVQMPDTDLIQHARLSRESPQEVAVISDITAVADPVQTAVADPVQTTAVAEPVQTAVAEPVQTTAVAEPVQTTAVADPAQTTAVAEPTCIPQSRHPVQTAREYFQQIYSTPGTYRIFDIHYFRSFTQWPYTYKQHNVALKWFREKAEDRGLDVADVSGAGLQVAEIDHPKGMGHTWNLNVTQYWEWQEMVAQLDDTKLVPGHEKTSLELVVEGTEHNRSRGLASCIIMKSAIYDHKRHYAKKHDPNWHFWFPAQPDAEANTGAELAAVAEDVESTGAVMGT